MTGSSMSTDASAPILSVRDLTRSYGSGAARMHALREVSFDVERGEVVALVGRSGAGKTTLLNCIGGLDMATSGEIDLDGIRVTDLDERGRTALRRGEVSFVFQTFGLLPALTAAENVGLPLRVRRVPRDEREARVARMLELVGLADHARQRSDELSGGQQQRVAIARALVTAPRLLIADEPTGQLDAATGASVLALLTEVVRAEGATAIISTHDPKVRAASTRTLTLADGGLVAG